MNTAPDATPEKAEKAKGYETLRSNLLDFASLFKTGIDRMAEIEKSAFDLAAKQTAETIQTCKKVLPASMPGLFVFDLAEQSCQRFADTCGKVVDLVVEQSAAILEATKRESKSATKIAENFTTEAKQAAERVIAAQKNILDFAAKQTKEVGGTLKKEAADLGEPASAVAESVQKGVETLIDSQRELLDNQQELLDRAIKPLEAAAGK